MTKTCRICKGKRLEPFLDLGMQPHCNHFLQAEDLGAEEPRWPLALLYCRDCHLVQLTTVVDPAFMFRHYLYVSGTTATLREHFRRSASDLVDRFRLGRGNLVVDIGSNDGTWLQQFKDRGLRVQGVDPAANIAEMANAAGIPTLADFFTEANAKAIRQAQGPADLITAAGVFFHIDDMDDVCRGIKALLADSGLVHIQAIYLGAMLKQTSYDNVYHEHVSYYTLHPLIRLFERFELEVFDLGFSEIHGGTMLLYVGHKGMHSVEPAVAAQLAYEREQGWDALDAYLAFAQRVQRNRDRLRSMIQELKSQGKRIAAYSAPAKGNTLLNYCQLGPDLLDYACERAPLKIGTHTPGMHLEVIDEQEAMRHPPDYFLLLAWNFKEELIRKNQAFRDGGGRFIIPIPEPHIV
jgi:SAM-dependent methyltransferase